MIAVGEALGDMPLKVSIDHGSEKSSPFADDAIGERNRAFACSPSRASLGSIRSIAETVRPGQVRPTCSLPIRTMSADAAALNQALFGRRFSRPLSIFHGSGERGTIGRGAPRAWHSGAGGCFGGLAPLQHLPLFLQLRPQICGGQIDRQLGNEGPRIIRAPVI